MLREAEQQLKSSLLDQDMVVTYLELVKVYRLDLPPTTLLYFESMPVLKERKSSAGDGIDRGVRGKRKIFYFSHILWTLASRRHTAGVHQTGPA